MGSRYKIGPLRSVVWDQTSRKEKTNKTSHKRHSEMNDIEIHSLLNGHLEIQRIPIAIWKGSNALSQHA